jgi:hypothetical protein
MMGTATVNLRNMNDDGKRELLKDINRCEQIAL